MPVGLHEVKHERQQAAKARCSALLVPSPYLLKGHSETLRLTCLQDCAT